LNKVFKKKTEKKFQKKFQKKSLVFIEIITLKTNKKGTITTIFDWNSGIVKITKSGFLVQKPQKGIIPSLQLSHFFLKFKKKVMEKKNEVFVLDLPNVGNEDIIKLTEQLILQSDKLMDVYRIENKNLIVDIVVKKN